MLVISADIIYIQYVYNICIIILNTNNNHVLIKTYQKTDINYYILYSHNITAVM